MGIDLIGTLRASNGIPVDRGNIHLSIPDRGISLRTVTDPDGRFKFSGLVFSDSTKVTISARDNTRASDLVITMDGELSQDAPLNYNKPDEIVNIDSTLSSYLKNSKKQFEDTHVLKEVVIKDTRITPKASHRDYGSLASLSDEPDHVITSEQLDGCNTPLECIKALASGMTFDNNNFYVMRDFTSGKRIPAAIFLRGQLVDVNTLLTLNAPDIESVEIFYKDELGLINSAYGTNGALVVNLKNKGTTPGTKITYQQMKDLMPAKNEITFTPKGYAPVKTFYLPRYIGPRGGQSQKTDLRSTIYWNPNVNSDKTGVASMEYYNADGQGTYRVTIEGIDKDGHIGRQVYRYTVR
jgi:hypothetical protein